MMNRNGAIWRESFKSSLNWWLAKLRKGLNNDYDSPDNRLDDFPLNFIPKMILNKLRSQHFNDI